MQPSAKELCFGTSYKIPVKILKEFSIKPSEKVFGETLDIIPEEVSGRTPGRITTKSQHVVTGGIPVEVLEAHGGNFEIMEDTLKGLPKELMVTS